MAYFLSGFLMKSSLSHIFGIHRNLVYARLIEAPDTTRHTAAN